MRNGAGLLSVAVGASNGAAPDQGGPHMSVSRSAQFIARLAATAIVSIGIALVAPVATAGAADGITAEFNGNGELIVRENGSPVALTPTSESDNTMHVATGSTQTGDQIVAIAYLEPAWGPAPNPPTETSGEDPDAVVAFTEEPDVVTPDEYAEESYSPSDYADEDLVPIVGEVTTPDSVIIVGGNIASGGGGGSGGGTLPVQPPVVEVYKDGRNVGALDENGTFTDANPGSRAHSYELVSGDRSVIVESAALQGSATTYATSALRNDRIWFNYKTFIPNERVSVIPGTLCRPWWTIGRVYFAGDNRSWSSTSNRYRTRAQVKADFTSNSRGVYLSKWVASTKRYKSSTSTSVVASATASTKNIKLSNVKMGTNSASYTLKHNVANPLCAAAGAIWYEVNATVWRNGTATFYGHHLLAPNHEAYVVGSEGGSYKTVARRPLKYFVCLTLDCGMGSWTNYFNKSIA